MYKLYPLTMLLVDFELIQGKTSPTANRPSRQGYQAKANNLKTTKYLQINGPSLPPHEILLLDFVFPSHRCRQKTEVLHRYHQRKRWL